MVTVVVQVVIEVVAVKMVVVIEVVMAMILVIEVVAVVMIVVFGVDCSSNQCKPHCRYSLALVGQRLLHQEVNAFAFGAFRLQSNPQYHS